MGLGEGVLEDDLVMRIDDLVINGTSSLIKETQEKSLSFPLSENVARRYNKQTSIRQHLELSQLAEQEDKHFCCLLATQCVAVFYSILNALGQYYTCTTHYSTKYCKILDK